MLNTEFIQKTRVNWTFTNLGSKGHNLIRIYAKVKIRQVKIAIRWKLKDLKKKGKNV